MRGSRSELRAALAASAVVLNFGRSWPLVWSPVRQELSLLLLHSEVSSASPRSCRSPVRVSPIAFQRVMLRVRGSPVVLWLCARPSRRLFAYLRARPCSRPSRFLRAVHGFSRCPLLPFVLFCALLLPGSPLFRGFPGSPWFPGFRGFPGFTRLRFTGFSLL